MWTNAATWAALRLFWRRGIVVYRMAHMSRYSPGAPTTTQLVVLITGSFAGVIVALLVGILTLFELKNAIENKTTIEGLKRGPSYDQGWDNNLNQLFGTSNPILWLLPYTILDGDGMEFDFDDISESDTDSDYSSDWDFFGGDDLQSYGVDIDHEIKVKAD